MPCRGTARPRGPIQCKDWIDTSGAWEDPVKELIGLTLTLWPMGSLSYLTSIKTRHGGQEIKGGGQLGEMEPGRSHTTTRGHCSQPCGSNLPHLGMGSEHNIER